MRTAVYAGTRNVYSDMSTACKSLLYNNGADRVIFLIEDNEFAEQLPSCVWCLNVSKQQFFKPNSPNYNSRWTYMTLMRTALPLIPEMPSRVLLLDIDTIVDGSIDELWALPSAPIYMAREVGRTSEYYNAGVMLMDTVLMYQDAQKIVRKLNMEHLHFPDQDAINTIMRGKIKQLPPQFNVSDWTVKPRCAPVITHYAAIRHWQNYPLWKKYENMSWNEVMRGKDA